MRILLTNHALCGPGGTETWTCQTVWALKEMGHEVSVYTMMPGQIFAELGKYCETVEEIHPDKYDLVMSNHNTCLYEALCAEAPIIHTCHGPAHGLEHPVVGAGQYVGVSEEVRLNGASYGFDMEVISNGVDLFHFHPTPQRHDTPRVLSLCKSVGASYMLSDACRLVGYDYEWFHYVEKPLKNVAEAMQEADIVVGCGRTVVEALACGREALVFDGRLDEPLADGWVTNENVEDLRRSNFSGRRRNYKWGMQQLTRALEQFRPRYWQRAWAVKHADIHRKAEEYLALYARMTKDDGTISETGAREATQGRTSTRRGRQLETA